MIESEMKISAVSAVKPQTVKAFKNRIIIKARTNTNPYNPRYVPPKDKEQSMQMIGYSIKVKCSLKWVHALNVGK